MASDLLDFVGKEDFIFSSNPKKTNPESWRIHRIGWEEWGPGFQVTRPGRPWLGRYTCLLVTQGRAFLESRGRRVCSDAGTIVCIDHTFAHSLNADPDNLPFCYALVFTGTPAPEALPPCEDIPLTLPTFSQLVGFVQTHWEYARQWGNKAEPICNASLPVFLELIKLGLHLEPLDRSTAHTKFAQCLALIERKAEKYCRVSEVAAACGISQEHLTRLFKQYSPDTPGELLLRQRMHRIADVLETDQSVNLSELAEQWGYSDAFSLSRAFKHIFGISPHRYRKA
jgi:AraC-like DNA-binding protein